MQEMERPKLEEEKAKEMEIERDSGENFERKRVEGLNGERRREEVDNKEEGEAFMEKAFKETEVPPWTKQITIRAMATSFGLSVVFNFIACKLNLTTGVIPSLNVAAGGTASYLLGMSPRIADRAEGGNTLANVKNLSIGWMMGFLFVVSFVGLFSIVPLRKIMILKNKLTCPSGSATAYLINSFHTPKGAKLAKKQAAALFKFFSFSFLWAFFQWFFAAADGCGFISFPTFGLKAYDQRFYFDFSATYVGVGMICPYMVNISLLFGAIISWGIMWPLIEAKKGDWYRADLPSSSLHGIQGYRIFIAIATMLGDGLFHVMYMLVKTLISLALQYSKKRDSSSVTPAANEENTNSETINYNEERRTEFFLKDQMPNWVAFLGYIGLAVISIVTVPLIFHQLKWYHILVAFVIAPVWHSAMHTDVVLLIGLASCAVMMSIVSTASDLMQDFKTGYLTLSSPRSMFLSQVAGTAMGCVITPLVFWFFYKAYPLGDPESTYAAPYGLIYRGIAILGVEGISSLPKNCLALSISFFVGAMIINLVTDLLQKYETKYRIHRFIPSPMCMAIPFYLGGYFAIDMCVGSLILYIWERRNKRMASEFGPAVASGLICGESLWGIPAAVLSLAGVSAPICMKFLSASVNTKVDNFLNG
ncbi:hypothetical protein GH714_031293 [Hevea brasiliensis]|uniref:Uncharacterized protein n=1 Tax=Hevea brasiliensis TaxID=3981 RepID=A0A6A6LFN5_HEVBR|nr:hypothetical protein GH714_031293 [Hevea brasiliensis]